MGEHPKELERQLNEMKQKKEKTDRLLLLLEWVICTLSCFALLAPILIGELVPMDKQLQIIISLSGVIPALAGFYFAIKIEQLAGYYQCKRCEHKHVPTYKAVLLAPHFGRTRYMGCPQCKRKSWQKKIVGEEYSIS